MHPATAALSATDIRKTEVSLFRDEDARAWDAFVLDSPHGTFFHLSGWRHAIRDTLGHRCLWHIARRGDQVTGVFPISWIRNKIFGDCFVSSPLGVYGGILADDESTYNQLLNAARGHGDRLGVKYLELRNRADLFPSALPSRNLYVTFIQDLEPGPDKLLQGMPRDTRYMIRKSLKSNLEWVQDDALDDFYEIYAANVHRLGTPVFPKRLFVCLQREFPQRCKIFGVRKSGKMIAGVFCFYFRDQVLPYYGGSLPEFNRDATNNFMYWNLIVQSCRDGLRWFDFGRSKKGTGACEFKSSWGMEVKDLPYRYVLLRATEVPHLSPVDKQFQTPVAIWKKMPPSWAKVLGPRVIRWIPSV
jgi:FemAB-related protein (PEP-CTERM system-associated)